MSDYSLDEPGFKDPGALPPAPPSSDSSVEAPPEVRRNCIACPRRMSKKTADRHTLCVSCRGFDCDIDSDVNGFFPVEKKKFFFFRKKNTKIKKTFFFFLFLV